MQDMLVCKQAYTKQLFFLKHQAHTVQVHHTHMILIFSDFFNFSIPVRHDCMSKKLRELKTLEFSCSKKLILRLKSNT